MNDLLVAIFGGIFLYLVISGVYFAYFCGKRTLDCSDTEDISDEKAELLTRVRTYLEKHGMSEEWLLRYGQEREILSWEPGSIFGRTVRRMEFGQRLPFASLEKASEGDLQRILRKGSAFAGYRKRVVEPHAHEVLQMR